MRTHTSLSAVVLASSSLLGASVANASTFTVTLTQVGPTVVATGSGSIDLTSLTSFGSAPASPEMYPANGIMGTGPSGTVDLYAGLSGPSSFGTGFGGFPSATSGDSVFLEDFGLDLEVPQGYVSGTSLASSATYSGTLASLNVTPGTYTWTWDSGADSYVLKIPPVTRVPEPSTFSLLALAGAAALAGRRRPRLRP
jgi:hypothetical protein